MMCPSCKSEQTYCINSREKNAVRRRRYQCSCCLKRFSTVETYAIRGQNPKEAGDPRGQQLLELIRAIVRE